MSKTMLRKSLFRIICLLGLAVIVSAVSFLLFLGGGVPKNGSALTSTASAVKAGNGAELWNKTTKEFNDTVLEDIVQKIFGDDDPVQFVKDNGAGEHSTTGSYIVPATTINTKVGSANDGLVITLDGKEWIAASLTLAEVAGTQDEVILTLFLANEDSASGVVKFYNSSSNNTKGNNAYSSSILRNFLLTSSNWSLYNTTGANSFAEQYLVQPKYIKYQEVETAVGRSNPPNGNYNSPNDAYGALSSGWYSGVNYQPADTFNDPNGNPVRYDAWSEDYIWIPSGVETGYTDHLGNTSLWKLTANQLTHNLNLYTWLRSGISTANDISYLHTKSGGYEYARTMITHGVRPAIHLNLSATGCLGKRLKDPSDIITTYNGNPQTLKTLYASKPASMSWYESEWYEHTGNYVSVTYYDSSNTVNTSVTNAGDYWVKVDLANWVAAVDETKKPRFKGTASSDGTHIESDTVRWFKITVNKADIDFSGVTWSPPSFEFDGTEKSVAISGFPDYLTPTITGDKATNAGDYTASVSAIAFKNDAMEDNYNSLSSTQLAAIAQLQHKWKITKKKITIIRQPNDTSVSTSPEIKVPSILCDTADAVQVSYVAADKSTPKTLDQIKAEYNPTTPTTYYAFVRLNPTGKYNSSNCDLYEGSTDVTSTGSYFQFTTGGDKTSITVNITKNSETYDGSAKPVTVTSSVSTLISTDFVVTYKMKDGTDIPAEKTDASGVPVGAGEYKAIVALGAGHDSYAITGQTEFDYTINKADYDLSGFKWIDETGAEYKAPYPWASGVSHTLSYSGTAPAGLSYAFTSTTAANATASDVGSYTVTVTFMVDAAHSVNYNTPDDVNFTWAITSGTLDLSQVKWDYEGPFTFKIENGTKVGYRVRLVNLPAELVDLIDYGGTTEPQTEVGTYTTSFTVDKSDPAYANFGELEFPATLRTSLSWEIKALTFEKPNPSQKETYRDSGYTFQDITNFPDNWEQYFSVEIVDSDETVVAPVGGSWTLMNVDQYRVKIQFQNGMNTSSGGSSDNVKWTDNGRGPWQVLFNLEQLVLPVKGWVEQGENVRPQLDAEPEILSQIEKYFDYVLVNAETDTEIPVNTVLAWETVYTIALKLKTGFEGNVAVEYMSTQGEETAPYAFMTDVDPLAPPPTSFYRKPTDEEVHVYYRYTGKEVNFKLGAWFVEDKMQILARAGSAESLLKGTEEGDYIVRVGFKKGARSAWEPASTVPADRAPVTITFTISKDAKLGDRFILKDGITVPFAFLYDDFSSVGAIEDYAFNADKLAYVSRLSLGDTLSALLSQFENGADITVYDLDGTTVITDYSTVVATGMYLRLMDGETVLNQLILSVLGEITGDGVINSKDKAQFNAYTLGKMKLTPAQLLASDITGDGVINSKDKAQLNSYTLGTTPLPVTPITVPAASSVSEVWEGAEVTETPVPVSFSEVAEEISEYATSAEVAKANSPIVATDSGADMPALSFPLWKGWKSVPYCHFDQAKRAEKSRRSRIYNMRSLCSLDFSTSSK